MNLAKILHIVGNRPQFIKLAPLYRELRKRGYGQNIVHSGQHFDANMSDIFFEELEIPTPDVNLHVNGGSHADMTARIMLALEPVVIEYAPDIVVLYGDTNTTLAAALVVRKLNIPIVHVEAGPRGWDETNPEEVNRVVTDRIATLLCAPDQSSLKNLRNEGLSQKSFFSGDVMYDTFLQSVDKVKERKIFDRFGLNRKEYILMTWHRQENTSDPARMNQILDLIEMSGERIVCPLHPRTRKMLKQFGLWERAGQISNLSIIDPVGYMEMVALLTNCMMTISDSGGVSKESFFAGVKCLFMLNFSVWPELEQSGWIVHEAAVKENPAFIAKQKQYADTGEKPLLYGDGHASFVIADKIEEYFGMK